MDTNTNTILSDVFNLFVSNDDMRPVMKKPFEHNGKIYATDAYTLIRIDKSDCDFAVLPEPSAPNCEAVMPTSNMNQLLSYDKAYFEQYKTEDEIVILGEDTECNTCDGYGEVEWEFQHYTREFDCPVCDGHGSVDNTYEQKTGNKTFGRFDLVKLKDTYLDVNKFYKVLEAKEKLGEDLYLTSLTSPNKAVVFKIGVCEMLIMPMMYNGVDDGTKKIIDLNL